MLDKVMLLTSKYYYCTTGTFSTAYNMRIFHKFDYFTIPVFKQAMGSVSTKRLEHSLTSNPALCLEIVGKQQRSKDPLAG
jgi:hypothetical protein